VNPDEKGDQVALGGDPGVIVGQSVIVKAAGEWKLGTVDKIDDAFVWSKVDVARIAYPPAKFKESLAGSYTIVRPFDPNAKGNGPYKHLVDPPSVGPFKSFLSTQKVAIIQDNRAKHSGSLVSDSSGNLVVLTTKRAKGAKVNPDEVNIDHIFPRSQGGWNSYGNAQVLSFSENLKKLDTIPDTF
jgi:hypothetical protein